MTKKSTKSTKSRSKKSSKRSTTSVLGFVVILAGVLFAQYVLGIDVLNEDKTSNTNDNAPVVEGNDNGGTSNDNAAVVDNTGTGGSSWYSVYFTEPINTNDVSRQVNAPIENAMVDVINSATKTIDGAMYEINLPRVVEALINAKNRGVQVRLVLDDVYAIEDEDSLASQLDAAGIPIVSDNRSAFMHHKFLVIDGSAVWMGSTNFTRNDVYNNNNNSLFIRSTQLAQNYTTDFEEMFIDKKFSARDNPRTTPNPIVTINGIRVENYFSPEDGKTIEQRLVDLVNNAQTSVHVMAFSYTIDALANAMISRHNAGVDVIGLFEARGSLQGAMRPMGCAGIPVKQDGNPQTLHNKVIIIDNQIVVTGSFNFSNNAIEQNSENMVIIYDAQLAQQYSAQFDKLYNDPRAEVPTASDLNCS
ncbi:MAG: phospholipase [Chloroflexi bacterium]|nr:phospholipase [Chloroflexota bacterium]